MTVIICGLRKSGFVRSAGAAASPAGNVILTAIGTIPLAVIVTPTIVIASLTIIMVILTIVFAAPTIIIVLFTIVIVALTIENVTLTIVIASPTIVIVIFTIVIVSLTIVIVTPTIVIATMTIVRMAALVLKTLKIAIFALFPGGWRAKRDSSAFGLWPDWVEPEARRYHRIPLGGARVSSPAAASPDLTAWDFLDADWTVHALRLGQPRSECCTGNLSRTSHSAL